VVKGHLHPQVPELRRVQTHVHHAAALVDHGAQATEDPTAEPIGEGRLGTAIL
jgi:hypothetical protein